MAENLECGVAGTVGGSTKPMECFRRVFRHPLTQVMEFSIWFLSVVRSRTDKSIELSRAALTVPRYGESNRLVGVD